MVSRAPVANAIVNIEALRIAMRNETSIGIAGLSYERKTGNTDTNRWKANAQGMWRAGDFENLATFEREFGSTNSNQDTNRTTEHVRVNWLYQNPISVELYGQLEDDAFRRLTMRALIGTGLRFRLADGERFKANAGAGGLWSRETQSYVPNTNDAGTLDINRGNLYLALNGLVSPEIELNAITYYQPSFSAFSDTRILSNAQAVLHVNKLISVTLNYSLSLDTEPPEQVQPSDQTYTTALNFKF
jgi:putative salt-induced outer membrane protein YdiY